MDCVFEYFINKCEPYINNPAGVDLRELLHLAQSLCANTKCPRGVLPLEQIHQPGGSTKVPYCFLDEGTIVHLRPGHPAAAFFGHVLYVGPVLAVFNALLNNVLDVLALTHNSSMTLLRVRISRCTHIQFLLIDIHHELRVPELLLPHSFSIGRPTLRLQPVLQTHFSDVLIPPGLLRIVVMPPVDHSCFGQVFNVIV